MDFIEEFYQSYRAYHTDYSSKGSFFNRANLIIYSSPGNTSGVSLVEMKFSFSSGT